MLWGLFAHTISRLSAGTKPLGGFGEGVRKRGSMRAPPHRRSAVFDFLGDLYLSAPGLPLVLCSDEAVILYFPTDYNPRERDRDASLEGEQCFTAVGSLITRDYRDPSPHFKIRILSSSPAP